MFFHSLGNETKLAESIQAEYRRSAAGFRRAKTLKAQLKKLARNKSIK